MVSPVVVVGAKHDTTPSSVGRLRVAEEHARTCWLRLVEHAQGGRCTCHLGIGGSVHVIAGCVTGRMLHDEYWTAAERVRELSPGLEIGDPRHDLEYGDFESGAVFQGRDGVMYDR